METIRTLNEISFDSLFATRNEAFRDYVRTWNRSEFKKILSRRGYSAELSFGAFDGDQLVSFTLNGTGEYYGKGTAYDTSTGTLPDYSGRGLATKVFIESIPFLKQAGIEQYLLEVLQHNVKAISVYSKLGFTVSREFNYFVQDVTEIQVVAKNMPDTIQIRTTDLAEKAIMMKCWDFIPSWQNSFDAIERNLADFQIVGAFQNDRLVGYGIIDPVWGDISQIAVDKEYRRQGVGTCILKELTDRNQYSQLQLINTETTCESITSFFEKSGITKRGMQFEMIKDLT